MNYKEKAVVFECLSETLVGVVHIPEKVLTSGVIAIVADAPQYRPGNCRQTLQFARYLVSRGTPVMRFDHRGIGDSSGQFPGYERQEDIRAAIDEFKSHIPQMKKIILYGGCDAASVIAIHGWRFPDVIGWVLVNPWVYTEKSNAQVMLKFYYLERLKSRDFWEKLIKLNFDFKSSIGAFFGFWNSVKSSQYNQHINQTFDPDDSSVSFVLRMFSGWEMFQGKVLIIKSDRSLVAKEFDSFVEQSENRKKIIQSKNVKEVMIHNADHVFSIPEARDKLFAEISKWLHQTL